MRISPIPILFYLLQFTVAIYDDELHQIDWVLYHIGNFLDDSLIVTSTNVFGITDLQLFVNLKVNSLVDDSIVFRRDITEGRLVKFGDYVVVNYIQDSLNFIDFYHLNGDLVLSNVYEGLIDLVIGNDVLAVKKDGSITTYDQKLNAKDISCDGVTMVASYDDKILLLNKDQISIYSHGEFVKSLKISLVALYGDHVLTKDAIYVIENLKLNKIQSVKGVKEINEHGYLVISEAGSIFYNYDGEEVVEFEGEYFLNDDTIIIQSDQIKVIDLETGIVLEKYNSPHAPLSALDYNSGTLTYISGSQGVIECHQDGDLKWTRDESLSQIKDFIIVDSINTLIAIEEREFNAENANWITGLVSRWKRHFKLLNWSRRTHQRDIDLFGLNKRLVLLGKKKLGSYNLAQHQIEWTIQLDKEYDRILTDFQGDHHSQFLLSTKDGVLDEIDQGGSIINSTVIGPVKSIHEFDHHFYLETQSQVIPLIEQDHSLKYGIEHDSNSISGLVLSDNISRTWSIPILPTEEVLSIVQRPDPNNDVVASIGVVLGDRSVLYKYLTPNLAVITLRDDNGDITVKLISVLTGEVLYLTKHQDEFIEVDSFQLIFDENFIIYKYFSYVPTIGTKVVVIDMFESLTPNEHTHSDTQSQFDSPMTPPAVSTKSFNFPQRVKELIMTRTRYNISIKNVLFWLESGKIVLIPKYILNSRRPVEALTKQELNEPMLLQYQPNIYYSDREAVLSNVNSLHVGPLAKMVSVPTMLESTTVVCLVSVDLYCTKFSPSGEFDILNENKFSRGKLVVTVLGLLVMTMLLQRLVKNKRLNSQWLVN